MMIITLILTTTINNNANDDDDDDDDDDDGDDDVDDVDDDDDDNFIIIKTCSRNTFRGKIFWNFNKNLIFDVKKIDTFCVKCSDVKCMNNTKRVSFERIM